jgi:hypothetical protein
MSVRHQSNGHHCAGHGCSGCIVEVFGTLDRTVAAWASVKARTPEEVNVWTRTAEKVIQRAALLGSITEPSP